MSAVALSTDDIDEILKNSTKFKGAFPCDQIPKFPDNEYSVIINVDNSTNLYYAICKCECKCTWNVM